MDNKPYISRIMSFITNMQYHKEGGSEPQPGPGPETSEWVVWDRTYKHRLNAKALNYDENVSWLPRKSSGGFVNLYHLDGSIITDQSDYDDAIANPNDAVIGTVSEEVKGQPIKSCLFIQNPVNLFGMPLYASDPVIFSGMPTEFDTVCTNDLSQIGDLSAVALPFYTFTGGHIDALNGLFYYNLVSEQSMTKEGVEYEHLLVHDLRAYEFWRELDKTLPDNKTGLFDQGATSNYTDGYVFASQPGKGGNYIWSICVQISEPVEDSGGTTIWMYPIESTDFKLAFNNGKTGSGMSNVVSKGYIELVGSQLFAYYNDTPTEMGE